MQSFRKELGLKTRITHNEVSDRVYCSAYLQASPQASAEAHYQALPDFLYVGGSGCGHPITYFAEGTCLFCFLFDAFQGEIPGQIHRSKSLAANGNPDQTATFQSYTAVSMGLKPPKNGENLKNWRRARKQYSEAAHGQFPITSALWELMGWQPPLATPLIAAVSGEKLPKIAEKMNISLYNLHERMQKGTRLTLQLLRS